MNCFAVIESETRIHISVMSLHLISTDPKGSCLFAFLITREERQMNEIPEKIVKKRVTMTTENNIFFRKLYFQLLSPS